VKRVRLFGAAATAVTGILGIPGAAIAATSGHRYPLHLHVPGKNPATDCPVNAQTSALSTHRHLLGGIGFAGECVAWQGATLDHSQTGLTERVRFYTSGKQTRQVRLPGLVSDGHTFFGSYPKYNATFVCQALVANGTSKVQYGPVCEYTSG
jgi:hypothetical protein